jgi:hypothetical protein
MSANKVTTSAGRASEKGLKAAAKADEKKVEKQKGSDLKKGADRFEERAKSAKRPPG